MESRYPGLLRRMEGFLFPFQATPGPNDPGRELNSSRSACPHVRHPYRAVGSHQSLCDLCKELAALVAGRHVLSNALQADD